MKPPQPTTQAPAVREPDSPLTIPQHRETDASVGHWDTLDKALHLLIQREEWLLGSALAQCNQLLAESREQVEEIKALFDEED